MERTFPLHSPVIQSIKIIKQGKTKRAKLYYLREKFGKKARKESMRFDAEASKEELERLHMEEEKKVGSAKEEKVKEQGEKTEEKK